jgi:hypothetical protein
MASGDELAKIARDSLRGNPDGTPGDPIDDAARLRERLKVILCRKAFDFIEQLPPIENQTNQAQLEQLAFAQQILRENSLHHRAAFMMILGELPDATTPAQILGATDAQLEAKLTPARLQALARGLRLG